MNQIVFSFTVFLAGILSFFSPCVFPLLPVYIGVLLGSDQEKSIQIFGKKIRWHGLVKTLCFIAGISVIFLIIGFGAGLLGQIMYTNWSGSRLCTCLSSIQWSRCPHGCSLSFYLYIRDGHSVFTFGSSIWDCSPIL